MNYFGDLRLHHYAHLPACRTWIDRRFRGYCALNFCAAGSIGWQEGEQEAPARLAGPLLWWSWPGPRFRYGSHDGQPWDHYYITFSGPRVRRWLASGLLPKEHRPYRVAAAPWREPWEALLALLAKEGPASPRAAHQLEGLLLAIHQPPAPAAHPGIPPALLTLCERVRTNPGAAWDFHTEARKAGLSYTHFRRQFRALEHKPPQRFLLETRLALAARLLSESPRAIKEIAETVGIPDVYYFGKCFKAQYGFPPGLYRREAYCSLPQKG